MDESREGLIYYEILPDGTCSYCGRETDVFLALGDERPIRRDDCEFCERYNQAVKAMKHVFLSKTINN
jgi:hypothetical protein